MNIIAYDAIPELYLVRYPDKKGVVKEMFCTNVDGPGAPVMPDCKHIKEFQDKEVSEFIRIDFEELQNSFIESIAILETLVPEFPVDGFESKDEAHHFNCLLLGVIERLNKLSDVTMNSFLKIKMPESLK